jgi:hypothetical protein
VPLESPEDGLNFLRSLEVELGERLGIEEQMFGELLEGF